MEPETDSERETEGGEMVKTGRRRRCTSGSQTGEEEW